MYPSELGENESLQTAKVKVEEVQNSRIENRELFDINSLPPGYRFNPTDTEVIVYYLRKKVDHQPLPPNKIIEVNLYAYDPEELAARYEPCGNHEWFFFTPRDKKYPKGQRPNRSVGDGYWKATGADKEIKFEDRKVGYRKALVFYRGSRAPHGVKTNWMMHEYRVADPPETLRITGVNDMRLDDCVLCRVYRKEYSRVRDCKRSRDESGNDESSSSSKIPRLDLNPNEANNQLIVGGGMEPVQERISYQYNPYINSHQALQNRQQQKQQQPITQIPEFANAVFPQDNPQVLPPNPYFNSHQALQNQKQQPITQIPEFANAVFPQDNPQILPPNPYMNSHQALQNQQQQPITQIPEFANAVFPQDNPQVLPPNPYFNSHQALQNQQQQQQPITQIPEFANAVFPRDNPQVLPPNPYFNSHQALQNQQQQQQQPITQIPEFANAVFPQDNPQVLPPNPYMNSHQALQNQQQQQKPITQIPEFANAVFPQDNPQVLPPNPYFNSHHAFQNQQQQKQPITQIPEFANAVFPQDNVLPPVGTDVSFYSQNYNLMQSMEFPYSNHSWDSEVYKQYLQSRVRFNHEYEPRLYAKRYYGQYGLIASTTEPSLCNP